MSEEEKDIHGATTIRSSKSGGSGGKWLIGAAAAVVLLGGGYLAWSMSQNPNQADYAYSDAYDNDRRAGALDSENYADDLSADENIAAPASADAPPPARRAAAPATPVPEATIGITPISATTTADDSDIVVTAAPRPVWASAPSARRLSAMYPTRQLERGREGEARLQCVVEDGGGLQCERVSETPGFGGAALRVANTLRHAPTRADGSSAGGTPVNLRVVFRIDESRRG